MSEGTRENIPPSEIEKLKFLPTKLIENFLVKYDVKSIGKDYYLVKARRLIQALEKNTTVTHLDLSRKFLIKNHFLIPCYQGRELKKPDIAALVSLLRKNKTITLLCFSGIVEKEAKELDEALKSNKSITTLKISCK
jgi:hypothetical protein